MLFVSKISDVKQSFFIFIFGDPNQLSAPLVIVYIRLTPSEAKTHPLSFKYSLVWLVSL